MEKTDLEVQFHEAVASTLRAMAGGTEHEVVFVGENTFIGNDKVRLPKINDIKSDSSRLRGEADKIALWIKYHLNVDLQNIFCTKLASKIGRTASGYHGYKDLVKEICKKDISKNND